MDWEQFPEYVAIAITTIATMGMVGAATMQIVKEVVRLLRTAIPAFQLELSAEFMTITSGLISAGLAAYVMHQTGTPLAVAILACIVALYSPKVTHDAVRHL